MSQIQGKGKADSLWDLHVVEFEKKKKEKKKTTLEM